MAIPKPLLLQRVWYQALPTEADVHRLKHQADLRNVHRVAHIRDDMAAYEAKFPAAVAVREQLGHARWEELEQYRMRTTRASISLRKIDRERIQVLREQLDPFLPEMRDWILRSFGHREAARFDQAHTAPVRDAGSMAEFQRWFHHKPALWLLYNLSFDVGQRMKWSQQMRWILWTLQQPQDHTISVSSPGGEVWIRAKIEIYQWFLEVRRPHVN